MPGGKKKAVPKQPVVEVEEEEEEEEYEEEEEAEFDLRGYLKSVPLNKRRRIYALKSLLGKTKKFEEEMQEKILALQATTLAKLQPLLEERRMIVSGEREPTDEEVAKSPDVVQEKAASKVEVLESSGEEEEKKERKGVKIVAPKDEEKVDILKEADADPKGGIPGFWLRAMQNNEVLEPSILSQDEEVLKHLDNITYDFVDGAPRKGYRIMFTFSDSNPFFGKKQLTKEYLMDLEDEDSEVLDKAVGCDIDWKDPATNPTIELKQKKQRKKGSSEVRVVTREEKRPSFFHFFAPPGNGTEEGEEDEEELMDMENDYEAGNALKDAVIPRAVYYYTGQVISDLAGAFGDVEFDHAEEDEEEQE